MDHHESRTVDMLASVFDSLLIMRMIASELREQANQSRHLIEESRLQITMVEVLMNRSSPRPQD
jgi:hypothetical protein